MQVWLIVSTDQSQSSTSWGFHHCKVRKNRAPGAQHGAIFEFWQHAFEFPHPINNSVYFMPMHCIYTNVKQGKIFTFQVLHYNKQFTLLLISLQDRYRADVRKHICIPCSPDLGKWLNHRSYKIDTMSLCLGHVKLSVLRNSAKMVSKNIICADEQKSLFSRKQKELKNHNPTN